MKVNLILAINDLNRSFRLSRCIIGIVKTIGPKSDYADTYMKQGGFVMLESVVGVDIAKKKCDVALFMNGKFKHKLV